MASLAAEPRQADSTITVGEALRLNCLSEARILAGAGGMDRRIRGVNIMDDIDIVRWMRGGELLLTTGYAVRDDPSALCTLVPALAERGLAAMAIKLGLYVDAFPAEAVAAADRLGFPVIGLPVRVLFNDILSEVLGTILNRQAVELERSNAIHARLTAVAVEGGSFHDLAGALAELVQRPVTIRDAHGQVLAATDGASDQFEDAHVVRPIHVGDIDDGEIVVWTDGAELVRHEVTAIEHAATVAAMAIAQERAVLSSERRHRTLLLMQLVSGGAVEQADVARWAAAMNWDMSRARGVVLVELSDAEGPVRVAGQALEEQLVRATQSALSSSPIVWGLQSGLAVLAEPLPSLGQVSRQLHAALHRLRPDARVMVAAGGVAADIGELSRSYLEAVSTLALGRELRGEDFVLEFDELGVYRLLSGLGPDQLRRHRDETIGALIEYDDAHSGALVSTLESFLRCEGNRVRAAEELFIHYNTLRYRLGQIEKLAGALSGDATTRLNLELALCAHKLLQGRERARTPSGARGRAV
jgi:purine catabolism regulator